MGMPPPAAPRDRGSRRNATPSCGSDGGVGRRGQRLDRRRSRDPGGSGHDRGPAPGLLADDGALAYSWAAPGIKQAFPDVGTFMGMVESGYMPVRRPRHYAFGQAVETSPASIVQQVLIVGPDGKDYEAVYTLELQPDGVWRITGVSLRESRSLGA
jgi:hypothetical protein